MEEICSGRIPAELHDLLYNELLKNPFMGINITDSAGTVLFVNEAHGRITGQDYKEYIGNTMEQLVKNKTVSESATVHVLKTGEEVFLAQAVSSGKTFQVKGIPIKDNDGTLKYVLNYLIDISELVEVKGKMSEIKAYNEKLENEYESLRKTIGNNGNLIFQSKTMQKIVDKAKKVAESDVTVLITGPSGSGKELIANIIHQESKRKDKPFVKINCAAIPEQLLESELFGYEPGAFTGGNPKGKKGLFESAHNGSLLLDEIGEMPLVLQSKLLRVLQDQEVRRIGGNKTIFVDFRLIVSTNAPLKEMIAQKKFRNDLYYRLNVIELKVPKLSERVEDIPLLVEHFVKMFNAKYGVSKSIEPEAVKYMAAADYPGNIRELRNIVERLIVQSLGDVISMQDAYEALGFLRIKTKGSDITVKMETLSNASLKEMVSEYEKSLLSKYMKIYGNGTMVAVKLKTDQSTISRKLSKYNIDTKQ